MLGESERISVSKHLKNREIWSPLVILVPYQSHHVPKYNKWMQDPELQYLTGSEPLTLEEEFEMLESWNNDSQKCTFIVLDRQHYDSLSNVENKIEREIQSMIGDVNFYLFNEENIAEIEIMIAEKWARKKGKGKEAAKLMMKFAHEIISIQRFQAKIKFSNIVSQKLFVDVFGFEEISRSDIFEEITYICDLRNNEKHRLKKLFKETSSVTKTIY